MSAGCGCHCASLNFCQSKPNDILKTQIGYRYVIGCKINSTLLEPYKKGVKTTYQNYEARPNPNILVIIVARKPSKLSSMKEGAGHRPKLGNPNLENTVLNVPSIIMIILKCQCLTMITNHRCASRILLNTYYIFTFTMHIFIYAATNRVHIYIYIHIYTNI